MEYKKGDRVKHPKKEEWGIGEVRADSKGAFVTVTFANAGEKKLSLEHVRLDKVSGEDSKSRLLDEIVNEGTGKYKIGKVPNIRAPHNRRTWEIVEEKLCSLGSASYEQLVIWCKGHDQASGGRGFVDYCIANGWLVLSTVDPAVSPQRSPPSQPTNRSLGGRVNAGVSGIYIVLLHTEQLMPVTRDPRYVHACARVNSKNVKIGKAKNFEARKQNYSSDFDAHNVEFVPLACLDDIQRAETAIIHRLDGFRMLSPKGGKLEWLVGISPEQAVRTAYAALDAGAFDYEIIDNKFFRSCSSFNSLA